MKSNEERIAEIKKRSGEIIKRRKKKRTAFLSLAVCLLVFASYLWVDSHNTVKIPVSESADDTIGDESVSYSAEIKFFQEYELKTVQTVSSPQSKDLYIYLSELIQNTLSIADYTYYTNDSAEYSALNNGSFQFDFSPENGYEIIVTENQNTYRYWINCAVNILTDISSGKTYYISYENMDYIKNYFTDFAE